MTENLNDNVNLDLVLQFFWGSSFWSAVLQECGQLSEPTKQVLLAKAREVDQLRAQLMQAEKTIDELANNMGHA